MYTCEILVNIDPHWGSFVLGEVVQRRDNSEVIANQERVQECRLSSESMIHHAS